MALSLRNVTTNGSGSTAFAILYQPADCGGAGWTVDTSRGSNGTLCSCTSASVPSAKFSFTGVAVYYASPSIRGPGSSVRFRLDGGPVEDITLSQGSNRSAEVQWSKTVLENGDHVLEMVPRQSTTLYVGSFTVTEVVPPGSFVASSPLNPLSSEAASHSLGHSEGAVDVDPPLDRAALALGVTIGAIALIGFIIISINSIRRKRDFENYQGFTPQADQYENDPPPQTFIEYDPESAIAVHKPQPTLIVSARKEISRTVDNPARSPGRAIPERQLDTEVRSVRSQDTHASTTPFVYRGTTSGVRMNLSRTSLDKDKGDPLLSQPVGGYPPPKVESPRRPGLTWKE